MLCTSINSIMELQWDLEVVHPLQFSVSITIDVHLNVALPKTSSAS
jgi:hypothetical protein